MGRLQQPDAHPQAAAEPGGRGGEDGNAKTGLGHAQENPLGYPKVPDLVCRAGDHGAQEEEQNPGYDDFSGADAVGGNSAEGGHGSADDAAQSVTKGDGHGAPAHVLLKGDHQHAEGLAHRTAGHMHEGRDGDDYPGVVDAGE